MVEQCLGRFGRLDVVIANAGANAQMGLLEPSPDARRSMVLTDVLGPALTVRTTLPHLLDREGGHYVFIGSLAASGSVPGSLYGATKAAVASLAESVRTELLFVRTVPAIRVTLVELGAVAKAMVPRIGCRSPPWNRTTSRAASSTPIGRPRHVDVDHIVLRPSGQSV